MTGLTPIGSVSGSALQMSPADTADDLRARMSQLYQDSKDIVTRFGSYSQTMAALGWEYNKARFQDALPGVPLIEDSITIVIDMTQTPKSMDAVLASLKTSALRVDQIRLDRDGRKAYIHCTPK